MKHPKIKTTNRVRTVQGSCWPCKKRRIKCDLAKPVCQRCVSVGATCNYNAQLIRWSTRPTVAVPATYQITNQEDLLGASLDVCERRALDYFHSRVWPLLTTASEPCAPPTLIALEHRVVLLATCVLADSHRMLQDGRSSQQALDNKRLECLAAVRLEVNSCCSSGQGPLMTLLFAVLLLYFHEGYMEGITRSASTLSHHTGVLAILNRLGGLDAALNICQDPMHMLLSEFATTDLTTSMLLATAPSFRPEVWDTIDKGSVWWGRDPLGRCSLASVFQQISIMAFYLDAMNNGLAELSMNKVHMFEDALRPVYAPMTIHDMDKMSPGGEDTMSSRDVEAVHAFTLIRSFQHTALIYLYRAICGLPTAHPLVQQHVQSCLDCIFEVDQSSRVLHCIIFPLYVAGAHALTPRNQHAVRNEFDLIFESMRFASVRSATAALEEMWATGAADLPWTDLFAYLSPHALVL